jgi:hypothetical protein
MMLETLTEALRLDHLWQTLQTTRMRYPLAQGLADEQ